MTTFDYPNSLIKEYDHWTIQTRRKQATAGALVLICKEEATSFANISAEAMCELSVVTADLEKALKDAVDFEKINYLMLMMVDPHVHFHVLPRYEGVRQLGTVAAIDHGWPKTPDMAEGVTLDDKALLEVTALLKSFIDK